MNVKNKVINFLKNFFKNNIKFNIYKKNIFNVIKFCKKNFNFLTYDQFFFIFKKIDLDDLDKIVYLINSVNIKVVEKIPYEYLVLNYKNNNYNFNEYDEFYNKKKYEDLNNKIIKNKYKNINNYLNKISKIFLSNIFLVNSIFRANNSKRLKNFIYKIKFLKSNLNIDQIFFFKYKKFSKKNFFIFKKKKRSKKVFKFNKILYSKFYFNLNRNFSLLNFLIDNTVKYRLKNKKKKYKILLKFFKKKVFNFKVSLDMIDDLDKILIKKFSNLNKIRIEIYDSISNIIEISYLKFNFFFLKNGSDLRWIINLIDFSKIEFLKNKFINFINLKSLEIKNIEKKYFTSLKNLFKIFSFIETNKIKIYIIRNDLIIFKKNIVNKILRKYYKNEFYGDILQEGNLSFIKSINSYDFNSDLKFDNFIIYNIKKDVNRYVYNDNRLIKLPEYMLSVIKKINEVIKNYNNKYNIDPDIKFISDKLNLNKNRIEKVLNLYKKTLSINKLSEDDKYEFTEFLKSSSDFDFDDKIFNTELQSYLEKLMSNLNNRSSNILNMRYGLNFLRRYTLAEIGNLYNLSRERIRQIQKSVLQKIKEISNDDKLKNFFKFRNKYYNF